MSTRQKVTVYLIGVVLGCLILLAIQRLRTTEPAGPHPWHSQTAPEGTYPLHFNDDFKRQLRLEKQPRWFISLAPSITEILFAMEMGDHLLAVSEWCTFPEEARALRDAGRQVGALDNPNRELVATYPADLILASTLTPPEVLASLHKTPRPVAVGFSHGNLAEVKKSIQTIGKITGVPAKANRLITKLEDRQAALAERIESVAKDQPPVRILFLLSLEPGLQPGWTAGSRTWITDIIESVHGTNVMDSIASSWGKVSMESLIAVDPQVIFIREPTDPEGIQTLKESIRRLSSHPVWSKLRAVQDQRVYTVPNGPFAIPGPRIIDAMEIAAGFTWF